MPLFLLKRHMQAIGSLHDSKVFARVAMALKPLVLSCSIKSINSGMSFLAFLAVMFLVRMSWLVICICW